MDDLTRASHKLAEEIYKQAASAKQQSQQAPGQEQPKQDEQTDEPKQYDKKEEDIIDAEYKEEDDKK